jgi:cytochrome c-type biogenesis protein CcmH
MTPRRPTRPGTVVLAGLLLALGTVLAVSLSGPGQAPSDKQVAEQIAAGLRCPVCKDLSAADSPAPLARQMRTQIRQQLAAGDTPDQIRQRFVTAYGPSVLISPPDNGWGRALAMAPWVLLAGGGLAGGLFLRRAVRRRPGRPAREAVRHPHVASLRRQLDDLDEDLAAGRVGESDYHEVRAPLAAELVETMRSLDARRPADLPPAGAGRQAARPRGVPRRRLLRWGVGVGLATAASVGVAVLLVGAVDPRIPGTSVTGGLEAGAAEAAQAGDSAATRPGAASKGLTGGQLAAVQKAVESVKKTPGRAAAHVELAGAYTEAGQPQLAAVEYLAATRLDPTNPEANTALALVAFQAGSARQAEALTTKALRGRPGHPEALYTRGLIRAMGLHRPVAATRDLEAYLRAAPFGSHRRTVATVLALLESGAIE